MNHMREHDRETATDLSQTAQRVAEVGRETASKAASYVKDGVDRATDYAQEWTGAASEKISDVTGRPPAEWLRQVREFIEQSPVKALVVAVAAGFVFGRIVRHG
jgi:ElaB/YqjD/DUF883 family membrane-anchored ribosome-binding protein